MHIHTYMVKPVSLSDPAFAALRKEKRPGESDSDVVLRLLREAHAARKDPWHFIKTRKLRERIWTPEEHAKILAETKQKDKEQALGKWRERHGGH
jgi:predicted CopG family antitoxin